MHYRRWQKHGDPAVVKSPRRGTCSFPGCERPHFCKGFCQLHFKRWQKHGDPTVVITGAMRRKGKPRIDGDGYVIYYQPEHPNAAKTGAVAEHTVVMAELLGRPIRSGETVHHKNGIRHDNHPENLELWVKAHPPGQRVSELLAFAHDLIERYKDDPQLWPEGLEPPH